MTSKAETIPARIAALKDSYIRQLPQQADELSSLWQAIRQHGWTGNDANRFQVLVHRLAGTAGTFGLLSLSDYAQGLDRLLDTITFSETRPAAEDVKRIGRLLHTLLTEFNMINASFQHPVEHDLRLESASGNNRILVIADDKEFASLLGVNLEACDYKVNVIHDATATLDNEVEAFEPGLIIMAMDSAEDEAQGADVIATLRKENRQPLPIIYLSVHDDMPSTLKPPGNDAHFYLRRPVDMNVLLTCAQSLMSIKAPLQDSAQAPAIAELIANMSHELRTPLNSILGFSQLLEMDTEKNLSEKQKDSLKPILNAGWHLLDLINEVIDLAKIEADKAPLAMASIDVQTVIHQATSLTDQAARDRHITVHNQLDNNATMVLADAGRLRQVLVNLLSNAIKYGPEKTDIAINGRRDQDATVMLSISYTGAGLPEEDSRDLFTTFNRPPGSEGPDLGLVICQQLIKRMHGEIGAYNNPDGGSTFWFKLPAAADDTNDKEQPVAD